MDKKQDHTAEHENVSIKNAAPEHERLAKNPNPRANENIDTRDVEQERTSGAGTEITDGEAG